MAVAMSQVQGQRDGSRSVSRLLRRTIRLAQLKIRSRSRLGTQRLAGPRSAGIAVQASSSHARATISHQIWFLVVSVQRQVP
jgi:hypothetical protein